MKKMISRKSTALLIALIMLCVLTLGACGGKNAADDPNLGVWNATIGEAMGISADISDFFGAGFAIELKAGGKCKITVDGETASGKWTLQDGAFTLSGGGIDCSGRLEDGTLVLDDVMGMGLKITFEKEAGGSAAVPKNNGPAGVWLGKTVTLPGEKPSDNFMGMMAVRDCIYLELKADGSVRLQYIGEFLDTTWEENGDSAGAIDFDGMPVDFELKDGELHLYIGEKGGAESLEYTLVPSDKSFDELSGGAATGTGGSADGAMNSELAAFDHPEHVATFEGDWYGIIYFEEGFGFWEGVDGGMLNAVARFAFRDGQCEAFFSTEMDPGDEEFNFQNITARIGTNGLAISGTLFDLEFENTLVREFEGESAMMYIDTDDYNDGFSAVLYLRPWGEAWTDSDPWAPSDDNLEFVAESTFEEIVEILGGDVTQIPASTSVAGSITASGGSNAVITANSDDSMNGAIDKYGLDSASTFWQNMSDERLTEAELLEKYESISKTPQYTMDYEDIVALIGIDPSNFWFDGEKRILEWVTDESSARYIHVVFAQQNGEWLYESFSKTNM